MAETIGDPYTLVVALNADGEASGALYVDDGETFEYAAMHEFVHRRFEWRRDPNDRQLVRFSSRSAAAATTSTISQATTTTPWRAAVVERIECFGLHASQIESATALGRALSFQSVVVGRRGKHTRLIVAGPNVPIADDIEITIKLKP